MCFAWGVLYDLSLFFLVYHNHPFCTHLLGETRMNQNLLEYSMCFSYIFGAREVWMLLHSLQTILFRQIAVMFALFAYVCLFDDSI